MTYRNRKLLNLAREAPKCFCCQTPNDGTVVAAHANLHGMGKGMGIKAHDWAIAFMCRECHTGYDVRKSVTHEDWALASVKSLGWLLESGYLVLK